MPCRCLCFRRASGVLQPVDAMRGASHWWSTGSQVLRTLGGPGGGPGANIVMQLVYTSGDNHYLVVHQDDDARGHFFTTTDVLHNGVQALNCFCEAVALYMCEWSPTQDVMELLQYALMASTNGPSTPPSTDADGAPQPRRPSLVVTGKNSDEARQLIVEKHLASGTALTITLVLMQPGKCWVVGEVLAEWGKTLMQVTLAGVLVVL